MSDLWKETTPTHISMVSDGYLEARFTLKVNNQEKPVTTSLTLQLKTPLSPVTTSPIASVLLTPSTAGSSTTAGAPASPAGTSGAPAASSSGAATSAGSTSTPAAPTAASAPPVFLPPLNSVAAVDADVLATTSNAARYSIEGVTGTGVYVFIIPTTVIKDFLFNNLVNSCQLLQTRSTLWKKVTLNLFLSKQRAAVLASGNFRSLREYQRYTFVCPTTMCGTIDGNSIPVRGAITINQYPGEYAENVSRSLTKQQDKPGRFFIRGCAASEEEALRGNAIQQLENFLANGAPITSASPYRLIPVIDVMGDIFEVRSTQSAGYVRVAAQRGQNPATRVEGEGTA